MASTPSIQPANTGVTATSITPFNLSIKRSTSLRDRILTYNRNSPGKIRPYGFRSRLSLHFYKETRVEFAEHALLPVPGDVALNKIQLLAALRENSTGRRTSISQDLLTLAIDHPVSVLEGHRIFAMGYDQALIPGDSDMPVWTYLELSGFLKGPRFDLTCLDQNTKLLFCPGKDFILVRL